MTNQSKHPFYRDSIEILTLKHFDKVKKLMNMLSENEDDLALLYAALIRKNSLLNAYFLSDFHYKNALYDFVLHTVNFLQRLYEFQNFAEKFEGHIHGLIQLRENLIKRKSHLNQIVLDIDTSAHTRTIIKKLNMIIENATKSVEKHLNDIHIVMVKLTRIYLEQDDFHYIIYEKFKDSPHLIEFAQHWLDQLNNSPPSSLSIA